jgi:ABC-2 type transport system permease protein
MSDLSPPNKQTENELTAKMSKGFSFRRMWGLMKKEFIQLKRDRMTVGMLIGIPFMQLMLFGFAINMDPQKLPTYLVQADDSVFARSYLKSLENTGYFDFKGRLESVLEIDSLFKKGEALFVITIPEDFSARLVRGDRPAVLIEVDATDPIAAQRAITAATNASLTSLSHDLKGPLAHLKGKEGPFEVRVHRRFNPENITQYNTVPGIVGVILTMTLVMVTSFALARERERGTLENLYAMPLKPLEVMLGKILPFIIGAYVQLTVVLVLAKLLFDIPMLGSFWVLSIGLVLFIMANLAVGFTFSTIAKNQLQAMQMSIFFFLPSILLSGFMFPFAGMPGWAQALGSGLPLTHFLRIIRGVLLKDASFVDIWPHLWPLMIILSVVSLIALKRYKATLD